MAVKLFVDTDISSNVDDAFALVLAARLPDVELLGVTTVGSMVAVRAQLARKVLAILGKRGVPVSAGCSQGLIEPPSRHFPEQASVLDEVDKLFFPPANGIDFLRDAIRRNPGDLVVVTLGAMTNLALVLRAEPALCRLIRRLVVMAVDVALPTGRGYIPDLTFIRRDREGELIGEDGKIHGAPDLVVEVISPSTKVRDRYKKMEG
jgi:purine nucleosidase